MIFVKLVFFVFDYDYGCCIVDVLVYVEVVCEQCVQKFMLICCQVLEVLFFSYWLLGVYEIIDEFVKFIVWLVLIMVYCVLDFFMVNGFVYCIES